MPLDLPQAVRRDDVDADRRRARTRVLQEVAAAPGRDPAATLPGLGGLSRLLRGLDANFRFTTAELGRVKQPVKYLPVWKLEGGWRPAQLVRLLPQQKAAIEQGKPVDTTRLPKHLPDRVVLLLGQEDLFPYRIEYRRQVDKKEAGEGEETRSLVTMELYEVNLNAPPSRRDSSTIPAAWSRKTRRKVFCSRWAEVSEASRVDRRAIGRPSPPGEGTSYRQFAIVQFNSQSRRRPAWRLEPTDGRAERISSCRPPLPRAPAQRRRRGPQA